MVCVLSFLFSSEFSSSSLLGAQFGRSLLPNTVEGGEKIRETACAVQPMVNVVHVSSYGLKRMLSQQGNTYDLFPGCSPSTCMFPHPYVVCLFTKSQEVTLTPQLLSFQKAFGKYFPRFALHCTGKVLHSTIASPNAGIPRIML